MEQKFSVNLFNIKPSSSSDNYSLEGFESSIPVQPQRSFSDIYQKYLELYQKENSETSTRKVPKSKTAYTDSKKFQKDYAAALMRNGVTNPEMVAAITGQALIETAGGKAAQGDYNYSNIHAPRSWNGKTVLGIDKDANGKKYQVKFKSYNSMDEAVLDKLKLLRNTYGIDFENDDINTFTRKLQGRKNGIGKYNYAEAKNYETTVKDGYKRARATLALTT